MSGLSSPRCQKPRFYIFVFIADGLCWMWRRWLSSTPGPTPAPTATPVPTPTPTPVPFAGVSIKVGDAVVPPGGIFQYQVLLTEPKPIGNGSTRPSFPQVRLDRCGVWPSMIRPDKP